MDGVKLRAYRELGHAEAIACEYPSAALARSQTNLLLTLSIDAPCLSFTSSIPWNGKGVHAVFKADPPRHWRLCRWLISGSYSTLSASQHAWHIATDSDPSTDCSILVCILSMPQQEYVVIYASFALNGFLLTENCSGDMYDD